jgi:hypothetical protein
VSQILLFRETRSHSRRPKISTTRKTNSKIRSAHAHMCMSTSITHLVVQLLSQRPSCLLSSSRTLYRTRAVIYVTRRRVRIKCGARTSFSRITAWLEFSVNTGYFRIYDNTKRLSLLAGVKMYGHLFAYGNLYFRSVDLPVAALPGPH